ncbi:ATP phosphoribosyltransferase regulatory subunit [Trinickia symbiotica]|uniref:ATP phosphoribosyltransferase regulatory subunit n=1 Tax=Trinickia symbiotica TaxID=863227 RepID=A0A2N7WP82_9BURK|nr:ATP phosphoribosyltransferase regulatory subunit [Trinickia symbiotica]PMS31213.1 ATP phosphoribosyltransferase regulatory subunit [Trinickia symbiotica]PPK41122.1 ATP phosphoribosyltransferase regulatory subunit [Trinickia symbiotica]
MPAQYAAIAPTIRQLFASRGAELVEVATVQPADPFIDVMGEGQRYYFFLTESDIHETLCLRPDFTIPVCLEHLRCGATIPRRYAYFGETFSKRPASRDGLLQAGLVDIGDPDAATADARSIADAYALLEGTLFGHDYATIIGDQAIFKAVLAALEVPGRWQKRLIRAFGAPVRLEAMFAKLAGPMPEMYIDEALKTFLARGHSDALTAYIKDIMSLGSVSPTAGRPPEEIATRLTETIELASARVPQATFDVLKSFLSIRVPLQRAPDEVARFAKSAGLTLGVAFDNFVKRAEVIDKQAVPLQEVTWDASFGRPLDHYTGLVFEIQVPGNDRPLASGGRYDCLATLLGAPQPIPAVGFSVLLTEIDQSRERMQ